MAVQVPMTLGVTPQPASVQVWKVQSACVWRGRGHDWLPPFPASGLHRFSVWQMQSGLIVCGGDPSLWLDPAKTLSISPTTSSAPTKKGPGAGS